MYMAAPGETVLAGLVLLIVLFVVPIIGSVFEPLFDHQEHDTDNSDLTITTEIPITPP